MRNQKFKKNSSINSSSINMIKILQKEWRNILTVSPYKNLIKSKNLMLSKQIGWMKFEIKRNKGWSKKKSKEKWDSKQCIR